MTAGADRTWLCDDIWHSIPAYMHESIAQAANRHRDADEARAIVRCIHVLRGNLRAGVGPDARAQRDADVAILETLLDAYRGPAA